MNITAVFSTTETVELSGAAPIETDTTDKIKKMASDQSRADESTQAKFPSSEEIKKLPDTLNEYMDHLQTDLSFFMHEKLNHQVIVEIKNRKTDELIKQVPPEELVTIKEKMSELMGLLFDKSV